MVLSRDDLVELAGLLETSIMDNYAIDGGQKRVASRLLRKIRSTYRRMK